jgi:hypothetical protein
VGREIYEKFAENRVKTAKNGLFRAILGLFCVFLEL